LACFYSARMAWNQTGVDTGKRYVNHPDIDYRAITGSYMVAPWGYWADLKSIDIMLDIGAGDSFADIYPDKRYAYIIATKALALARGKRLILSPQTIGPFTRQPHTALAVWACRKAEIIFVRDPMSMSVLREMAPDSNARQAIDVAFALPFDRAERTPCGPVRVGINASGLLMSGGYSGQNEFGISIDYAALTRAIIADFLAMPNVEVTLVPHVITSGIARDDDTSTADQLKAEFPALVRGPNFASPSEAKSFISRLDFLLGARMHATIAAYSAGVPVVPISYSRKFEGLYGGLHYPWLVPAKGITTEQARAFILDAFARRDEMAADIRKGDAAIAAGIEVYTAELARQFAAVTA
ncbi:MAG: polysaccharide pyruvyl transferase family protein, partial [Polymorphobacter sp.]